jgi:hypothetical protein
MTWSGRPHESSAPATRRTEGSWPSIVPRSYRDGRTAVAEPPLVPDDRPPQPVRVGRRQDALSGSPDVVRSEPKSRARDVSRETSIRRPPTIRRLAPRALRRCVAASQSQPSRSSGSAPRACAIGAPPTPPRSMLGWWSEAFHRAQDHRCRVLTRRCQRPVCRRLQSRGSVVPVARPAAACAAGLRGGWRLPCRAAVPAPGLVP